MIVILCTNFWKSINKWRWPNMLNLTGNVYLLVGASDHYGNLRKGEYLGKIPRRIPRRLFWALLTSPSFVGERETDSTPRCFRLQNARLGGS